MPRLDNLHFFGCLIRKARYLQIGYRVPGAGLHSVAEREVFRPRLARILQIFFRLSTREDDIARNIDVGHGVSDPLLVVSQLEPLVLHFLGLLFYSVIQT